MIVYNTDIVFPRDIVRLYLEYVTDDVVPLPTTAFEILAN